MHVAAGEGHLEAILLLVQLVWRLSQAAAGLPVTLEGFQRVPDIGVCRSINARGLAGRPYRENSFKETYWGSSAALEMNVCWIRHSTASGSLVSG